VGKAGLLTRPQNKINSQISAIGLRGFFWERVRAIDISRGEHLRNFGNKWLEGDGWKDVMEKYPSDWPDNIVAWQKLLWAEMKEVWEDRDNVPTSDTMEEEVVKVVGEVNEELDFQLKNLLRAGNADKATRDKIIRRILNLISIIIDKRVNDLFKALPVAIESVKEQTRQSFEEWQKGLLQKGVGFSVLRRHYATSIKAISKIHKEASQHKTQFDHPGIMRLVRATVEAREKIPATESSFFSTVTTFSFLLCLFFYLSEIVFGYGLLTRLLISTGLSLGISVSIIYFYLKKQSDITNALWRDLSEMVTENTGSLMRHRLNRALADIIDGTNDKPGAKQLMVEQEKALIRAIEAGRRERDDFLRESNNKIPDQIQTVFSHSQNPADASYTPNWDRDMENKTDEWAKSYWYNRKFEGDVPDNFTPLWQQMSEDHREFLLKELTGYNLGVDAIQANVWNKLKNSTFRAKIPRQAVIDETLVKGQFRQYSNQVYAPSEWKKDVMAHVEEHGDPVTYQEVQNENAICIFSIIDGLEWNALMSAAIPEVYILKPGDGETSEQAIERGLLDLHEVRRELNSGNFSSNECFLWAFQKISGGATGKLNPVPDEKGNHQPTKAVGPHEKPTNIIVLSSHGLSTGHRVRLMADKGGAKEGADYYIRKIDDNSFKLYNTLVNAHEGHTGGAAALTACDDISFTLHENDITPGGQRAGQTGQKWEFLQKLDGKSRVLYYFPSLPEALASALADAVQRAKQRGDESDIILPPPPDSQL
jgi:hypothetical protein